MARTINLSRGYGALSTEDKLYLAHRGRLPHEHIDDELRALLDYSKPRSDVAYGAHTGTVRTMTIEELEAEIARRKAEQTIENPKDELMPGLDNPHSERWEADEENRKKFDAEAEQRRAAADRASSGPVVPTLGTPTKSGSELLDSGDDNDGEFTPTRESGEDAYLSDEWTNVRRRQELNGRGLKVEGKKAELVARLKRDDASELTEDDYAEEEDDSTGDGGE